MIAKFSSPHRMNAATLRSVDLNGPAGKLEAVVNEGDPDAPFAALVCHPHPLGGGSLHNKVVYHAMKVLNATQWAQRLPVLRFNFRGTGLSQGKHDGEAEVGDVLAALDWLVNEYNRPIVATGFSFGAAMTIKACCGPQKNQAAIQALVAIGLPLHSNGRDYSYPCLADCDLPKLFLSGDCDQFASTDQLAGVAESAAYPKKLAFVPGADHFFTGQLESMQHVFSDWLKEQLL